MTVAVNGSQATWWWNCGSGCPPVRLTFPVHLSPESIGADGVMRATAIVDNDDRLLPLAVAAHMAGNH